MKKLINVKWLLMLVLMLSLTMVDANAQRRGQYLTSTGSNVNVRTGPGKNYKVHTVVTWDFDRLRDVRVKLQLGRGQRVKYLGQKKNGFIYVQVEGDFEYDRFKYVNGWVSADYLTW